MTVEGEHSGEYLSPRRTSCKPVTWKSTSMSTMTVTSSSTAQLVDGINGNGTGPLHGTLSGREFQVFCKIAIGETSSQIAAELFLSAKTVGTYRSRILDKMAMKSSAEITSYAIRNDLIR